MGGKRFYFLKLRRDFFKRHDIRILKSMPDGNSLVLFYIQLLTESVDHEGALRYSPTKPYTPEMLAAITDTSAEFVAGALEVLEAAELITTDEDGTINLPYAIRMLDSEADNDNARRQARYRATHKNSNGNSNATVTDSNANSNATVTQNNVTSVTKSNESIEYRDKSIEYRDIEREMYKEKEACASRTPRPRFTPPSPDDILNYMTDYAHKKGLDVNPVVEAEKFFNHYEANGWRVGRNCMKDYQAACRNWLLKATEDSKNNTVITNPFIDLIDEEGGNV